MTFNEAIQAHLDHYYRLIRSVINLNRRLKALEQRCEKCPYRRAEEKQTELEKTMREIDQLSDKELEANHQRAYGDGVAGLLKEEEQRKAKNTKAIIGRRITRKEALETLREIQATAEQEREEEREKESERGIKELT